MTFVCCRSVCLFGPDMQVKGAQVDTWGEWDGVSESWRTVTAGVEARRKEQGGTCRREGGGESEGLIACLTTHIISSRLGYRSDAIRRHPSPALGKSCMVAGSEHPRGTR